MTTAFGALGSCLLPAKAKFYLRAQEDYMPNTGRVEPGDAAVLVMKRPGKNNPVYSPAEVAKIAFRYMDADEAAGFQLSKIQQEYPQQIAFLEYACVIPAYRGCGLGGPLLQEFQRVLRYEGVEFVVGEFHSRRIVKLMEKVFGQMLYAEDPQASDLNRKEVMQVLPEATPEEPRDFTPYPFVRPGPFVRIWFRV